MDSRDYYRGREANERLAAANSINNESRTIHTDLADKYAGWPTSQRQSNRAARTFDRNVDCRYCL